MLTIARGGRASDDMVQRCSFLFQDLPLFHPECGVPKVPRERQEDGYENVAEESC